MVQNTAIHDQFDTKRVNGKTLCDIVRNMKAITLTKNRRYISYETYPKTVYPNFLSGTAYIMSNDVVLPLYYASLNTSFFRLEDVYLTGTITNS